MRSGQELSTFAHIQLLLRSWATTAQYLQREGKKLAANPEWCSNPMAGVGLYWLLITTFKPPKLASTTAEQSSLYQTPIQAALATLVRLHWAHEPTCALITQLVSVLQVAGLAGQLCAIGLDPLLECPGQPVHWMLTNNEPDAWEALPASQLAPEIAVDVERLRVAASSGMRDGLDLAYLEYAVHFTLVEKLVRRHPAAA